MPNRTASAALQRQPRQGGSRWLVPAVLVTLGIVTVVLILFALGVLLGVVRF